MAWTWRQYTDWAKRRPLTLRLADALGRGKGRLRLFDDLHPPIRAPFVPDLRDWEEHDLAACWIGHATVLLRIGGMTILTDFSLAYVVRARVLRAAAAKRRHQQQCDAVARPGSSLIPSSRVSVVAAHRCPTLTRRTSSRPS